MTARRAVPVALVIFDCDGVLVDSERLSQTVLREMLLEMGASLTYEETVLRFMGTSMATCVARITELLGHRPPDAFLEEFSRRTRSAFEAGLTRVPGVEQVLASLGVQYCVASNGNRAKVQFTLGHTGLLQRFEGRIFTVDDVRRGKPAPDLFLHAARTLGADPGRTTVVEDSPTGILAAKAAGMRAVGFAAMTPASRLRDAGADAIAHTMREVQAALAGPAAGAR